MRIVSGFHVREILDEVIAVPTGEAAGKLSGIVGLNEVGRFLFERLNRECTEQELVQAVLDTYALHGGMRAEQERVECIMPGAAVRKKCSVRESVAVPPEAPEARRRMAWRISWG